MNSTEARKALDDAAFREHVDLLRLFLARRDEIVASIEGVLNAQRKPARYPQGASFVPQQLDGCFFAPGVVTASQARFKGQLEAAYCASGFQPRQVQHLYNDLIHPAEMLARATHCWHRTQWPSRSGRMHYAHTLFNLYILRCLQFLSMRLWDAEERTAPKHVAGPRLAEIQGVLNELWRSSPAHQPAFVRDASWLIPLAQSLITDELAPYFHIAQQVTDALPQADALEVQKAHVRMLGGHLTSQIRYYSTKDRVSISDPGVVVRTRTSNALDLALLVQGLVAVLRAYETAVRNADERIRLDMAGAIFQGISPDPELFLNRLDLLNAYSRIEHVFISIERAPGGESHVAYSPQGERHERFLEEYSRLINRLLQPLRDDLPRFHPLEGRCSPYGVVFGLPSNLIEHMALKAIERDAETTFSLEDIFRDETASGDASIGAAKLAWVNGWRKLPHIEREVQHLYDYPQSFAEAIYCRIAQELATLETAKTGGLYIEPTATSECTKEAIPTVPSRYFLSSDKQILLAQKAEPYDQAQLLRDRQEGHFLVSYETPGGWIALKKNLLAEVLAAGQNAKIIGLPGEAAQALRLMCAGLVISNQPPEQNQSTEL